ncbi:hypothetical protein HNY73_007865 [Argiope bruennichi]|uniref:Uncharacterized protein n=1 Tax=Argiope bruennichi TaxID=94029 RepID=A0A8T0F6R7_ARGBR|nr:hypothetical protein HNY73_007865 [Argiope bruennichi]
MKAFPVLFLLTFILPIGASNRTAVLFDITKQTLDLFPSLRKMARSEDERKGPLTETAFKRISDVIANFRGLRLSSIDATPAIVSFSTAFLTLVSFKISFLRII